MVNRVLYHLGSRGIEYSLKPWMDANDVSLMAYCPLAQGGVLREELILLLSAVVVDHGIIQKEYVGRLCRCNRTEPAGQE